MKRLMNYLCLALISLLGMKATGQTSWPELRGPSRDGHAKSSTLPLTWNETNQVVWKSEIPGLGWSSPVIWGDQIWLTTATEDGKKMSAVCVQINAGKILKERVVFENERVEHIASVNSYASPTPAIEAGRLYAHYGTYGTACIDTQSGQLLWTRRDLNCDHHEGPGSSVMLHKNLLICNVDGRDVQYVVALDKSSGKTVWKTQRSVDYSPFPINCRKAFCTPIVIEVNGQLQLISPGAKATMAYNPDTGIEIWKLRYNGWSMVPRPLYGHGLVFIISDYERPVLWAVSPLGQGDITTSQVTWKIEKDMPATAALLLIDDLLFMVNDQGVAICLEAKTGSPVWRERMPGKHSASPIYGAGRIYFFNEKGIATVLKPGRTFEKLAENRLEDRLMATPAVADNSFFIRTQKYLWRIGGKDKD